MAAPSTISVRPPPSPAARSRATGPSAATAASSPRAKPIVGNGLGGAIRTAAGGSLTVENSTFTGNQAIGGNGGSGGSGANGPYELDLGGGGAILGFRCRAGHQRMYVRLQPGHRRLQRHGRHQRHGAGRRRHRRGPEVNGTAADGHEQHLRPQPGPGRQRQHGRRAASSTSAWVAAARSFVGYLSRDRLDRQQPDRHQQPGHRRDGQHGRPPGGRRHRRRARGRRRHTATISDSTIANNQAIGGQGAAGGNGGDGLGGGLANFLGATFTVSNCTVTGNQAIGGAGGSGANGGNGLGGGVYNDGRSTLTILVSTITDNQAIGGAAGVGGVAGLGEGGGLYLADGGIACLDAFTQATRRTTTPRPITTTSSARSRPAEPGAAPEGRAGTTPGVRLGRRAQGSGSAGGPRRPGEVHRPASRCRPAEAIGMGLARRLRRIEPQRPPGASRSRAGLPSSS